jgi:cation:H+ antiporter
MDIALLLLGGAMLYFGAEWLVGGASRVALSLRIPQLLVGLTVVAYGTSAPELVVGVQAARAGHGEVAIGNVIGSNIANFGLILGASTLVRPARVDGALRKRELPVLLGATLAVPWTLFDGVVTMAEAGALVLASVAYTVWMIRTSKTSAERAEAAFDAAGTAQAAEAAGAPTLRTRAQHLLLALTGLAVLLVGGRVFVDAATRLAEAWGMSPRLVGLTIVAVGTSLPELATGVISAARGHSDIAVGNVVGSCIFNVLLCLGAAGLAGPVACPPQMFASDIGALIVVSVLGVAFMRTERRMRRWEGAVLLLGYGAFVAYASLR